MPRDYTYIIFTDFVYIRVTGMIWCYNGLTNPNNLDKDAGDAIKDVYLSIEREKPIIIDCKGVSGVTDHSWDILFKSINNTKREIIFINFQSISQKINASKVEFCTSLKMKSEDDSFSIYNNSLKIKSLDNINVLVDKHIVSTIKEMVQRSFTEYPNGEMKLLSSTPVYSNGEFDASDLISHQKSFYWISLKLSDVVKELIQKYRIGGINSKIKILAVSLRSSPFAAAVSLLLGLQIETVDHFGPIFRNYEPDASTSDVNEYIYIGDFSVGGTEIKISKTYAHLKKSMLNHAVVIGSLLSSDCYKEFMMHSIVLLRDCSPNVKYSIENNLPIP